jgi:FkbM family methyltransferase
METSYPLACMAVYAQLARAGFRPEVIYDIGASNACWSSNVVGLFPTATYHLFEPLADTISSYREGLQWALAEHPLFNVHRMALGDSSGTVTIAITPDPAGSTALAVESSTCFPEKTTRPLHTLDELLESGLLTPPHLVKIDVQGSEDRILRGGRHALKSAQVLQIECWLYPGYGPETARMADIVEMLDDLGFIAVESSDPYYSEGHQLCTLDLYFIRKELTKSWALSGQQGSWVDGRG